MSYPVDESCLGVYDKCGSVMEWLDAWYDERRRLRHAAGGSWARSEPAINKLWGGLGFPPESTNAEVGFRVLLEISK
jgi:formylglycine-generating enzyme required for sulfatase activity